VNKGLKEGLIGMSNPWTALKSARLTRNQSLEEVAKALYIPKAYLEAIENGEFSFLSDPVDVRRLIRIYAKFLNIDPNPVCRAYREKRQTAVVIPSRGRSHRKYGNRKKRSFYFHNKRVLWGSMIGVFIGVSGWIGLFSSNPEESIAESAIPSIQTLKPETAKVIQNPVKPEVRLLKSSETYKYGDLYRIGHTDRIELKLVAKEFTKICIRTEGPTGPILVEKELAPHQMETFTHHRWLSLHVLQPSFVTLSVNGVIIDTIHSYIHFELEQNKKRRDVTTNPP
jgi:cytoskeletal protein RodZ